MGTAFVLLAVAVAAALAIRSMWRSRKSGGSCNGDCGKCRGCR